VIVGAVECVSKTTLERSAIASQPTALTMASIPVIARAVECVPKTTMEKSAKCTALQKTVTSWGTIRVPVMVAESVWRDTRVGALERTAQSVFPPQAAPREHVMAQVNANVCLDMLDLCAYKILMCVVMLDRVVTKATVLTWDLTATSVRVSLVTKGLIVQTALYFFQGTCW
jgi:hypothetical protein